MYQNLEAVLLASLEVVVLDSIHQMGTSFPCHVKKVLH
jgi:hypothetical protein